MPFKTKAIIRSEQVDAQGIPYEVRIFRRPNGGYTRGFYADDNALDTDPRADIEEVPERDAELLIKLLTGKAVTD